MTPISCIYRITNIITGKFYIGSTNNYAHRKRQHLHDLRNKHHGNTHLQSAWNKYGSSAFEFEVLEKLINVNLLTTREQFWLDSLQACDHKIGYNVSLQANRTELAEETKKKIGDANRGRHPSYETRIKIGLASKGRHHSPETCEKIRIASTGRHLSDEVKQYIRRLKLGKTQSDEHRLKNSLGHIGHHLSEEHHKKLLLANIGRRNSEVQREKMRVSAKSRCKTVLQYSLDGTLIKEFQSLHDVQRLAGYNLQNVHSVCRGKSKTACGFKWRYKI